MTVPFMYNFRSFSNKSATIFWSLIFHILLSRLAIFHSKKETWNFRIQKSDVEKKFFSTSLSNY